MEIQSDRCEQCWTLEERLLAAHGSYLSALHNWEEKPLNSTNFYIALYGLEGAKKALLECNEQLNAHRSIHNYPVSPNGENNTRRRSHPDSPAVGQFELTQPLN